LRIYNNNVQAGEFKRFIWRKDGSLLLRLDGLNVVYGRHFDVLPVYRPLIFFQKTKGHLRIELPFKDNIWRINFLRRKPYIYTEFFSSNKEILE